MNSIKLTVFFSLLLSFATCVNAQQKIEQWNRFEMALKSASTDSTTKEVQLTATFAGPDTSVVVTGFYDGNNTFKIRFMPQKTGVWSYTTSSNIPEFNDKQDTLECIKATGNNHGMVKVSNTYDFKYADGKRYYPFGTTAYAWTHMSEAVQKMTLNSLKKSGFNKVRMCVFPKDYSLVKEEPELYPFELKETQKDALGKEVKVWDFNQFNPIFFQHLEKRIDELSEMGIEADLILFHPYDKGRWGFDAMPMDVNIKYINYLTARLSSFKNVWWSLANEWDFVKAKSHEDWITLSKATVKADPYRHLCSIHGSTGCYFEYWNPEFTHVSIQDNEPVMTQGTAAILRHIYKKPIVLDEIGYEGNLKSRWGRYSPEEMTNLIWNGIMCGVYVTHGDTYTDGVANDTIFWAKGGPLRGTSWKRISFLRKLLEECPMPLQMADVSRDNRTSSAGNGYYFVYFGKEIMDSWMFNLPEKNMDKSLGFEKPKAGNRYKVEIIDTWDMTLTSYPETFEITKENNYCFYDKDLKKVRLPLKPYIALRITEIPQQTRYPHAIVKIK